MRSGCLQSRALLQGICLLLELLGRGEGNRERQGAEAKRRERTKINRKGRGDAYFFAEFLQLFRHALAVAAVPAPREKQLLLVLGGQLVRGDLAQDGGALGRE